MSVIPEFVAGPALEGAAGRAVAVPVFADGVFGPGTADILGDQVTDEHLEDLGFSGKLGEVAVVPLRGTGFSVAYLVGLGDELDSERLRQAAGWLGKAARTAELATTLHLVDLDGAAGAVAEGFALGHYRFDDYKSADSPTRTERLIFLDGADEGELQRAQVVTAAVAEARDLVNRPALDLPPSAVSAMAEVLAEELGLECQVWSGQEVIDEGFGGLAGVNAGSVEPAAMIRLIYSPEGATRSLALVGKGILFDSGGLSIKPAESMKTMKDDMAGAAAVLAAMGAIARLGVKIKVTAITPVTENLPSGSATRPGDVLTARNGKTMEVLNTDAEGRLVLAEGLSLAMEDDADLVVDVATLTGACSVALGERIGGVFANDDEAAAQVVAAGARAGERLWHLPLEAEYRSDIDSDLADVRNTGSNRYGGAIKAALFLQEFVDGRPWVHIDIAGPAWADSPGYYLTKGGVGFGVRTLVALAEDQSTL